MVLRKLLGSVPPMDETMTTCFTPGGKIGGQIGMEDCAEVMASAAT